ncbi:PLP-dependent aminotransferase family protein [Rhodoferax sp. GW822-FHT02A01]|uniref:aminotransferase-like domain-containing protein n=1 Tax=Rhodoferax sp. GW822-FHT02A01 TaxID=3141537 RepID=UPI00315CF41F
MQSFNDFTPAHDGGAIYQQLADEIERRVTVGQLKPGEHLPPQREFARILGVNLTTITRAFATLQRRGVVASRPGRGSVVTGLAEELAFVSAPEREPGLIDLSVNRPATTDYLEALARFLPKLPKDPRYADLQDFHAPEGPSWAREAVATWLEPVLGERDPGRIVIAQGAQSALSSVFGAIARPGDVVLADAVTYQGMTALCRTLNLVLQPVEMDQDGLRPDALENACNEHRPRALFVVPCLQNPTAITMTLERRGHISEIARRHDLLIVEDDVYRPLVSDAPPAFARICPERTVYVTGMSKTVAPGLRFGVAIAPTALVGDIAAMQRVACWSIAPLTALVATRLIEDGTLDQIVAAQTGELRARQLLLQEALAGFDFQSGEASPHAWIKLPSPWRANAFAAVARTQGVAVMAAEAFAIGQHAAPHAVRVNLAAARSRSDLQRALEVLVQVMKSGERHVPSLV